MKLRPPSRLLTAGFAVCLFFIVLGAKWAVFDHWGSPMPDWDQWDAEAVELLIPWFEGDHFASHLFHAHNEHRVVLTKLETLTLTLANDQWDSRVLAVTNAILHSLMAAACWLLARRAVAARWHAPLFLLTIALFALPFAWQNVLGGFHSQQYWLLGLSLATMAALPFVRTWGAGWWAAIVVAALTLITMGSGFLASAVVLVVVAFRWVRRETTVAAAWPTLVATAGLVAVGWFTRVEPEFHAGLRAASVHDFVFCTLRSMEWPLRDQDWAGLLLWLPWFILLYRVVTAPRDGADRRAGQTIAALGGWVMLQILATSYARGIGADYPAPRYMDTLGFGALINAVALGWLAADFAPRSRRIALGALAAAWLVLFSIGLWKLTVQAFQIDLPDAKKYYGHAEGYLRGYLATNDPAHFAFPDIPFPSADGLVERLENPHLRALMPAAVRAPLPFHPAGSPRPDGNASSSTAAKIANASTTHSPGPSIAGQTTFLENEAKSLVPGKPPRRGLSPKTTPLDYAKTWGSYGPDGPANVGEWRSRPLWSPLGAWLKFETAGQIGEPGVSLELRDAETGAVLANVRPTKVPGDTWRAAYVRAPQGHFVVVARDTDPTRWMAFSAPVEMGSLSYWAWQTSKQGLLIVYFAAGFTAVLLLVAWRGGAADRAAGSSPF